MNPVIILAGGLGTRLRSVVPDMPKPMAEVAGKPFLWWMLQRLVQQGVTDVHLAVGYKHEVIRAYFGDAFESLRLHYVVEDSPLGTGGALAKAMAQIDDDRAYVLNGDTMAIVDLAALGRAAEPDDVDLAVAVAHLPDVSRYGAVEFDPGTRRIAAFKEKGLQGAGYINAGVYLLKREPFMRRVPGERFSFEQDVLYARLAEMNVVVLPDVTRFIDIGIPEDYALAQREVPDMVGQGHG